MKTKKLISVLLAIALVCAAIPSFALITANATEPGEVAVYVSSIGNDSTGDGTEANPYATISKAEAVLEADGSAVTGVVVMLTDMTFTSAAHTKMITITGNTGSENLTRTGSVISVNGPTTFSNFNVNDTFNHASNGNEVIYDNITFDTSRGIFYLGNIDSSVTTPNNITLNGLGQAVNKGANIRIGPHMSGGNPSTSATNGTINSDINIVMNGGYYNQFWMLNGTYNGDLNVTLNSGGMYNGCQFDFYGVNKSTYNGAFQLLLNNGFSVSKVYVSEVEKINAANGSWFMYCDNSGGMLSTTATPGTFSVSDGAMAIATNTSTDEVYSSVGGVLTVPAGKYDATYERTVFYVSSSGNNSTGNGSADNPYATIAKAESVIEASSVDSGEVIMLTDMSFTSAAHTKMITIKGNIGTESLTQTASTPISANGPTTFSNFNVDATFNMVTDGNEVIYKNITFDTSRGNFYIGSSSSDITTPNNITFEEFGQSAWHGSNLRIGPQTRGGVMNSDLNITVNSGYFNQFWVHEGTYNGNVSYTINGGTVYGGDPFIDPYSINNHVYNGAYQVILNNGISSSKISPTVEGNVTAAGGKWLMYCDNSGGMLATTATPGTFAVEEGKFAKATLNGDSSKVYRGIPGGNVSLPAGSYDVTYYSELSASEYDANVDTNIDVKDLVAAKKASYSYDSAYISWAFYNSLFLRNLTDYILYN